MLLFARRKVNAIVRKGGGWEGGGGVGVGE